MYAFAKIIKNAEHTRRYTIRPTTTGWEVRQEQDSLVVRQVCYQDWHRVEHARRAFVTELTALQAEGWQEIQAAAAD